MHLRIAIAASLWLCLAGICGQVLAVSSAPSPESTWGEWSPLVARLAADGVCQEDIAALFSSSKAQYDPQVMVGKLRALLAARQRAAQERAGAQRPPQPQPDFVESMLGGLALAGAHAYMDYHHDELEVAQRQYGVEKEVQVALLLVETKLGLSTGDREAAVTLASMALARDFEMVRPYIGYDALPPADQQWVKSRCVDKADWAYRELKALLAYARQVGVAPLSILGSASGAIGQPQFMPSSALAYGVDGDGDGKVDLFATTDALFSLANFLKRHGWRPGLSRERQIAVLLRYNQSESYARAILEAAARLRGEPRTAQALP